MNNSQNAILVCFSCLQPTFCVSRCAHPMDRYRINKNLHIWRKHNNLSGNINTYDAHIIEKLVLSTPNSGEIYLTDHIYDGKKQIKLTKLAMGKIQVSQSP